MERNMREKQCQDTAAVQGCWVLLEKQLDEDVKTWNICPSSPGEAMETHGKEGSFGYHRINAQVMLEE